MTTSGSARWRKRKKPRLTSQKMASCTISKTLTPRKFGPIQMGEFLRKYVSRRLLALTGGEIAASTTSERQIGVPTPGGAEALATFHQLLYGDGVTGSLSGPLARVKADEKNCFGVIEWKAVREVASRFLPKHTAAAAWTCQNLSHVEQEGLSPMPKDRGAVQGDVDRPLECSLALGMVAADTQGSIAARQAAGTLPWIGVNDPAVQQRLQADHAARLQESANFQHALQKTWAWRTSGTWMTVTSCVTQSLCYLFFKTSTSPTPASELSGTHRKRKYVDDLDAAPPEWPKPLQSPTAASHSESLLDLGSSSRTSS